MSKTLLHVDYFNLMKSIIGLGYRRVSTLVFIDRKYSGTIWDLILFFSVRIIWLFKRPRRPLYVARFLGQLIDYIYKNLKFKV
jgi:hypothetical protein